MAEPAFSVGHANKPDLLRGTKRDIEDFLSELFMRFSTRDGLIKGFAGNWSFYQPESAEEASTTSNFRCIRTYETLESDPSVIRFRTFNDLRPTNNKAWQRQQDDLYESGYQRLASDSFFSAAMGLSNIEENSGMPACIFWRCVAVDCQNVVRIAPALPPDTQTPGHAANLMYPKWTADQISRSVFAFEAFLQEGDQRWCMGAIYSVESCKLLAHFCIQERLVNVDPEGAIDFNELTSIELRERLDSDPETWVDSEIFKGEMTEVLWDEDGEMIKLPSRPTGWCPPQQDLTTYSLFRYKDSMYAYYPKELPSSQAGCANYFYQGARFEMGGICQEGLFRRLVLRYAPDGRVASLTKELHKTKGSFDFERSKSCQIRRSVDRRRSNAAGNVISLLSNRQGNLASKPSPKIYSPDAVKGETETTQATELH